MKYSTALDKKRPVDACIATRYSRVIVSFRHKGLKRLFEKDDAAGIRPDMLDKVRTILIQLDEAASIEDMRLASFHLHALQGDRKGFWSVTVRANWRVIFRFTAGKVDDVELIDYH
jgi:toxin HigB-1